MDKSHILQCVKIVREYGGIKLKKVSIKDVAREAGVSITTVSRALNGYMDISESTKKKIYAVVKQLDYVPNTNARSLGGIEETNIALLTSELTSTDKSGMVYGLLCGLSGQCTEQGYEFMLLATNLAKQQKLSFNQLCKKKNLSGVVVAGLKTGDPYHKEIMESNIPCVGIDMQMHGSKKCSVSIDNIKAAKEAVSYLVQLGHKKIGMINGSKEADVSGQRYSGYVSALIDSGISLKLDYMINCDFLEPVAYEKTKQFLKDYPEITALFCASDLMAIGAIKAIKELGKRVPEDISVVGFDDIPVSEYICGGITTIRQNPMYLGNESGKVIASILKGEQEEDHVYVPYELIIRNTTAICKD